MALLFFEIKKIWGTRLFKAVLLFLAFATALFFYIVDTKMVSFESVIAEDQDQIYSLNQHILLLETQLKQDQNNHSLQIELDGQIDFKENLIQQLDAFENEDWSSYFSKLATSSKEMMLESKRQLTQINYNSYLWPTPFTFISLYELYSWLEKYSIEPILPIHNFSWKTAYDKEFENQIVENFVMKSSTKYSSKGIYFTYEVLKIFLSWTGVILFIFLFADVITKEGYQKNGPIHLLKILPIKRYKILLTKFTLLITSNITTLLGLIIFSLGLGIIFNGLGNWRYPILIYSESKELFFIGIGTYLGKCLLLFIFFMLFTNSLLFFYSILTNRTILVLGFTILTLIVGLALSLQEIFLPITQFLPFHYIDVFTIVSNEYALQHNLFSIHFSNGLITLAAWSILILLLTFIITKLKKGGTT